MRQMTPLLRHLRDLAREAGLSHPLGRACAAVNRHYNTGMTAPEEAEVDLMASFQESTALRWLEHYLAGGSLKTLERTHEQEAARRRVYERKRRKLLREYAEGREE